MSKRKLPSKARLIPAGEVYAEWRKSPTYRKAYDAIDDEFEIMAELIKARSKSGLSQAQIAARMKTTQSAIARLEGMSHRASLATLRAYAAANGHKLKIALEPIDK